MRERYLKWSARVIFGLVFRRSLQLLAQLLVPALLLSSQCYAMCAVSACTSSSHHTSECHHHPEKGRDSGEGCQHSHIDFFSPEGCTSLVKLSVSPVRGAVALLSVAPSRVWGNSKVEILQRSEHHLPPTTSVFALLSTFRV